MRRRCRDPKNTNYRNYGARGIKVCERWDSFWDFVSDMGIRPDGMTVDRINNNGDYEPSNCRWASRLVQRRNQRFLKIITIDGESGILVDWCKKLGIKFGVVRTRLYKGWDIEEALFTPASQWQRVKVNGKSIGMRPRSILWGYKDGFVKDAETGKFLSTTLQQQNVEKP